MNLTILVRHACLTLLIGLGLAGSQLRGDTSSAAVAVTDDGVQRVTLVGGSYYFEPERIVVRAGVPVELQVRRRPGLAPHNLVIRSSTMGLDIEASLDTEPTTIRFTPRVAGRVEFYCDKRLLFLPSHRERGMVGVLEVIE
ncbi:cupredoxin domain-containing protein [Billgrantia lactosivorans]|uniref:cupredoxin domain-containing protein n=1 Tax=Billgrantia lactosivorans TaxID=2185141 RepID=UPI000DAE6E99|nr:cupredoxin domain-containing protein [Halomonas lactosivorans]